jgi:hypothetical protein
MPDETLWVWIEDAAKEYGKSRAWLDEQVRHGAITYQKFEGDRRTYLLRTDVERVVGQSNASRMRPRHDAQAG